VGVPRWHEEEQFCVRFWFPDAAADTFQKGFSGRRLSYSLSSPSSFAPSQNAENLPITALVHADRNQQRGEGGVRRGMMGKNLVAQGM